jgi:uncharacterized protein
VSSRPTHVDPRSPLVFDTRELGRRAGSMLELHRDLTAPAGWELDLVRVPVGTAVSLDLRLESVMDGVLASAELQAPLSAECGRCLQPVERRLDVSIAELFVYEPDPDDDEVPVLDGDLLDLEPVLRDAVVLALPFNPVCDETCAGLCVTCGERLDDLEPGHSHEVLDPRWAALSALGEQNSRPSATMERPAVDSPDPAGSNTAGSNTARSNTARSNREN